MTNLDLMIKTAIVTATATFVFSFICAISYVAVKQINKPTEYTQSDVDKMVKEIEELDKSIAELDKASGEK